MDGSEKSVAQMIFMPRLKAEGVPAIGRGDRERGRSFCARPPPSRTNCRLTAGSQRASLLQPYAWMLSSTEARARLASCGPNVVVAGRRWSWPRQLLAKLRNPLLLLLLAASTVSGLTGDLRSFTVIAVMAALSLSLDLIQERRAGRAAERLRQSTVLRASVVRDGREQEIPATELVPGDLVLLTAGDLVPADALVDEAHDLFVNQTLLTGE